ncbi:MAG: MMPL family transporter [Treponema sp.]|nr:MMPL family transporter [Treponema sp.]
MKNLLKHSKLVIFICLAITVALAIPLVSVSIENTVRRYMPPKSESYTRLIGTEDQFGSMISIGISLETDDESILTSEYISVIREITDQIDALEGIKSINSITKIDYVYSLDGGLAAGQLLDDDYTGSKADIQKIKQKIIDWQDMYNRVIIDDDFQAAQIAATVDPEFGSTQQIELLHKIQNIAYKAIEGHNLEVRFYGDPVLSDNASDYMIHDLLTLIPLVTLVVLLSLYFSFHTFSGTLLPLISVLMSTIWSCGIMSLAHVTFTIVASVIPVCLIACGSAYGIHVITHYEAAVKKIEGEITKEKHLDAICAGLKDVWIAVLLAAITTIAGFISLVTSPIEPLKSFAIFSATGVAFSLLTSITFIPAALSLCPLNRIGKRRFSQLSEKIKAKVLRERERLGGHKAEARGRTLYNIYHFCAGTKPRLVIFSALICLFSFLGVKQLVINTSLVGYFPPDSKFRKDIDFVDETFAGTNDVYFVISGQEKGDMTKPEILKKVDDLQNHLLAEYPEIGKAVSFTTFIKRMNQVMHAPMLSADSGDDFAAADAGSYAEDDWGSSDEWADSSDDWGSSGDDWADSGDDWGDSSSDESEAQTAAETKDWVDPNIQYAKDLQEQITVQKALEMFASAYTAAGGKNATVDGMMKELEKLFNFNGIDYYEVPYDLDKYPAATREGLANLVSQYLLLYSGQLDRFSDDQLAPKTIRMQVQLRCHDTHKIKEIIQEAQDYAKANFPVGYTLVPTGNGEMEVSMTDMVISSQVTSILFSIFMVFVIIAVSFKSPVAGLLGAVPLAFTIILNFMTMGWTGIQLDLVTSIIASVAIGVGIDYTIHFMESYKAERAKSDNVEEVTMRTFAVSGLGIVTNALAVGLGFLVLLFSNFQILRCIGLLVAIVMFSSSFLAMTVIPGVLNAFDPKFIRPKEEKKN